MFFECQRPTTQELVANNALNVGAVLPAQETRVRKPGDLVSDGISIYRNGEIRGTADADESAMGHSKPCCGFPTDYAISDCG